MQPKNFQKEMAQAIETIPPATPLLLHSCCAPCSGSVMETLANHFTLKIVYYNPNIWPLEEYEKRKQEQFAFVAQLPQGKGIEIISPAYTPEDFSPILQGKEQLAEGGARCMECFALRLGFTAKTAKELGIKWFCSTLTVSPHKNTTLVNRAGQQAAEKHGVNYLVNDFKKNNGYLRSLQLSEKYKLYRQQYCGCQPSYQQRMAWEQKKNTDF